jgi:hypothetical protein
MMGWRWEKCGLWGGLLVAILTACAPPPDPAPNLTAAALHSTLTTQIAVLRTTATFEADRRALTEVAALDGLARSSQRQARIINTIEALDFPRPNARLITPAAFPTSAIQATPTPDIQNMGGGVTAAAPTIDPNITPTLTLPPTEPPPPTHTLSPDAPRLAGVVTSVGVDSNDCPLNPTSTFSASTSQIYVAATAFNLAQGDVVTSRWIKDGAEVAYYEFAPTFKINGACIWFFVDQTDFTFTIGSTYTIDLFINGVNAQMVSFTIE